MQTYSDRRAKLGIKIIALIGIVSLVALFAFGRWHDNTYYGETAQIETTK